MKLEKVVIHKYKNFENVQEFEIEDDVTILVGMNESGKTSALEAIAKTNYFQDDEQFKFNMTHDFPRRQKKQADKLGKSPEAITCYYLIDEDLKKIIDDDIGEDVFDTTQFNVTTLFNRKRTIGGLKASTENFILNKTKEYGIASSTLNTKLATVTTQADLKTVIAEYSEESKIEGLNKLIKYLPNKKNWDDYLTEYIWEKYIKPNLPKFLYYDEYYSLPSRISISDLNNGTLKEEELKTAKALFELADLKPEEIVSADSFEDYIAELEATEAIISDELFEYWSTNNNLNIEFKIDKIECKNGQNRIIDHVLDIRVKNQRTRVSLPLKNRSKGFNWFFSFLVWFKKIQEDQDSNYVLLLDEPGLNLHASAQADLLRFIENLSANYQIIYTTHSPFAIPSGKLERVRTVLDTKDGSKISDSIQEKDPDTLFPLQAALGYDIAQNLFLSNKNLLVEGVSDLVILTALSGLLEAAGRKFLRDDITIVPTGGLEKVATFISLLRGSKLEIACLLDSYTDARGKQKMDSMISGKIIQRGKVKFFDEFITDMEKADLEDLFTKEDYLKLFNGAFEEYSDIKVSELNSDIDRVILQINQNIDKKRFNHYRPAIYLSSLGADESFFDDDTLDKFEQVFESMNALFE